MSQNSIRKILNEGNWYHTFLYDDIKTKGTFDYTNNMSDLNLPSLEDLEVLDVGCSDGFFSKYFVESLNAKNVTGVDINNYNGEVAFEVLDSYKPQFKEKYEIHNDFERLSDAYSDLSLKDSNKFNFIKKIYEIPNISFESGSIYELEKFHPRDVVFCGSLFEHLRDPVTAMEQLLFTTKEFCIIDISNTFKSLRIGKKPYIEYTNTGGNFFKYSENSVLQMMSNVGFKKVSILSSYKIKIEKYGYKIPHSVFIGYK